MKQIQTGKGTISLLTLLAIWSVSLVINLPGLAISPLLGKLHLVFPKAPVIEVQLLEVFPNFFIIPFILLSGRLAGSKNKVALLLAGLGIFLASGVAYLFSESLTLLIVWSCTLGIGGGLVIPLSVGLIADNFSGRRRMVQMGLQSGISNMTVVVATLIVGVLATRGWHLPFLVYLVAIIPLAFLPFLSPRALDNNKGKTDATPSAPAPDSSIGACDVSPGNRVADLWAVMTAYFVITFCCIAISYYLPLRMQTLGMTDTQTGIATSMLYLFMTIPGFCLGRIVGATRDATAHICYLLMCAGLALVAFVPNFAAFCCGVTLVGLGYGTMQPIFYNKAAVLSADRGDSTRTVSYVMSANYVSVAATPFIIDGVCSLLKVGPETHAYVIAMVVMAALVVVGIFCRRTFLFCVEKS